MTCECGCKRIIRSLLKRRKFHQECRAKKWNTYSAHVRWVNYVPKGWR